MGNGRRVRSDSDITPTVATSSPTGVRECVFGHISDTVTVKLRLYLFLYMLYAHIHTERERESHRTSACME